MGCGGSKGVHPDNLGTGFIPAKEKGDYVPSAVQWIVGDGKLLMFHKDKLSIEKAKVPIFLPSYLMVLKSANAAELFYSKTVLWLQEAASTTMLSISMFATNLIRLIRRKKSKIVQIYQKRCNSLKITNLGLVCF